MLKKLLTVFFLHFLFICLLQAAGAEEAKVLTPLRVSSTIKQDELPYLFDRSYFTVWYAKRGYIQIELAQNDPACGIYICFHKKVTPVVIQVPDRDKGFSDYKTVAGEYLHQFVALPGVRSLRIRIADEASKEMLELAELRLLGAGSVPEWVQQWYTAEKADLMLLCGHPDDDLLWFGGAIPYYAAERQMHVQVVYLARGDSWRHNELLDALWLCGVRDYPTVSPFHDVRTENRSAVYGAWGGTKVFYPWFVSVLRRYRPDVLITQDLNGEYGHAVHQVAAYTAINCPPLAANPAYDPASAAKYGPWQVRKVYLHLYKPDQIVMDWDQPLRAFGGMSGTEVANSALSCHKSQQPIGYSAQTSGRYDCRLFGLYYSSVGPDVEKDDFFENIERPMLTFSFAD